MSEIAGLPFWELHFNKTGKLLKHVGGIPPQITDLFLFAHAWNNDYNDAKDFYHMFFEQMAEELVEHGAKPDVQIGLAGVFWPCALWPGDEPLLETTGAPIFGPVERDWSEELKTAYDEPAERAAIDRMRQIVDHRPSHPDGIAEFKALLHTLAQGAAPEIEDFAAVATAKAHHGGGFPKALSGLWRGAEEAVRLTSYSTMKARAEVVGERGLGAFFATMPDTLRVHLLGSGFGARLVVSSLKAGSPIVKSLFLMGRDSDVDVSPESKIQPVIDTRVDILDHKVARAVLVAFGVV